MYAALAPEIQQTPTTDDKTANHRTTGETNASDRVANEVPSRYCITVVSETLPPDINGVAMTMGKLIQGLQSSGHTIDLVCPDSLGTGVALTGTKKRLTVRGMQIPFYRDMQFGFPATKRLTRNWTEKRPDVVHIVTEGPLGLSALKAANKLNIPVVTGFHTNFHSYSKHYGLAMLESAIMRYLRWFHNKADVTLVPTKELADTLEAAGINNTKVLSRGVDIMQFSPCHRSESLRQSWGAAGNDPVAIYVGRLAAEKNLDLALEAYCEFKALQPRAKMVLVGDGPLMQKMKNHPAEPIVCGSLSGQTLAQHYASADLFLFPSRSETFGNVTLEAMASGLAVIAFNYAAALHHIEHGINGMLADFHSDEDYLLAARNIATRPEMIQQLRERARVAVQGYDWSKIHRKLTDVYDGACS